MLQSTQKPSERGRNRMCTAHQHCKYISSNIIQFSCIVALGLQTSESGRERKCDSLPVGRAGPEVTGPARPCLKVVLCWGWQGCPSPPPAQVSASAAAERQLVPMDGNGFENESAIWEEGRNLPEESVCVKTSSFPFHMQLLC